MNVYFKNGSTFTSIYDLIYPIGSIWFGTNAGGKEPTPASAFGGTWGRLSENFILPITNRSSHAPGNTSGSWNRTLTVANIPSHSHKLGFYRNGDASWVGSSTARAAQLSSTTGIGFQGNICIWNAANTGYNSGNTGSGSAFSIANPYRYENVWYRSA